MLLPGSPKASLAPPLAVAKALVRSSGAHANADCVSLEVDEAAAAATTTAATPVIPQRQVVALRASAAAATTTAAAPVIPQRQVVAPPVVGGDWLLLLLETLDVANFCFVLTMDSKFSIVVTICMAGEPDFVMNGVGCGKWLLLQPIEKEGIRWPPLGAAGR